MTIGAATLLVVLAGTAVRLWSESSPCQRLGGPRELPVSLGLNRETGVYCVSWNVDTGEDVFVRVAQLAQPGIEGRADLAELTFGGSPISASGRPKNYEKVIEQRYLDLPKDYLPPLARGPQRCFEQGISFRIIVGRNFDEPLGGEDWFGCQRIPRTASGCDAEWDGSAVVFGNAEFLPGRPLCITWHDSYKNEQRYDIAMSLGGRQFTFVAPGDTHELVLPAEAQVNLRYTSADWRIYVILEDGLQDFVGEGGAIYD